MMLLKMQSLMQTIVTWLIPIAANIQRNGMSMISKDYHTTPTNSFLRRLNDNLQHHIFLILINKYRSTQSSVYLVHYFFSHPLAFFLHHTVLLSPSGQPFLVSIDPLVKVVVLDVSLHSFLLRCYSFKVKNPLGLPVTWIIFAVCTQPFFHTEITCFAIMNKFPWIIKQKMYGFPLFPFLLHPI
jgi:hypothetical protein